MNETTTVKESDAVQAGSNATVVYDWKPDDPKPVAVDWRNKVGAAVVAKYGDKDYSGVLKGVVDGGRLVCELEGVDSEVELPRYLVTLAEQPKVVNKAEPVKAGKKAG